RTLRRVGGDTDHQMIHQLHGALDQVQVAQGDGVEGAGIKAGKLLAGHSPPPASAMRSTDTTFSPSSTLNTVTPWAARPWTETLEAATRMIWPPSEISIRSSDSSTGKEAM